MLLFGFGFLSPGAPYPPSSNYDKTPSSPSAMDDEFEGAISGNWTVVDGSPGTVNPAATTGSGAIYDVTSSRKGLLVQPDTNSDLQLRQDYTLPDGKIAILKFRPGLNYHSYADNELRVFLSLNDDDADYANLTNGRVSIFWDTQANSTRIFASSNGGANFNSSVIGTPGAFMLGIGRNGTDYYVYFCGPAGILMPLAQYSPGVVLDNVWIVVAGGASFVAPLAVTQIDWIRQSDFIGGPGNMFDPWP